MQPHNSKSWFEYQTAVFFSFLEIFSNQQSHIISQKNPSRSSPRQHLRAILIQQLYQRYTDRYRFHSYVRRRLCLHNIRRKFNSSHRQSPRRGRSHIHWVCQVNIILNADKSESKIFILRRIKDPKKITISNVQLEWNPRDKAVRYLGLHFDTRLTWKFHITTRLRLAHRRLQQLWLMAAA